MTTLASAYVGCQLLGKYKVVGDQLKSIDEPGRPILHIRKRSAPGKKPRLFLAIHKPVFRHISGLFETKSTDKSVRCWSFDYQQKYYLLEITGETATIRELEKEQA
jgi:hypothetical protein